jgi:hypothetical protein
LATAVLATALPAVHGCGAGSGSDEPGTKPGDAADSDGDTISDFDEGRGAKVDSDGDGAPDYLDPESDGDGIDDLVEAGDADLATPPVDNDGDSSPDFRDLDSDGNVIADSVEGALDSDGDAIGNYADTDNDGDQGLDVAEIMGASADCDSDTLADAQGTPEAPANCDGDAIANYLDVDSDNDFISDGEERDLDSDSDGFLNRYDLDSDNDRFSDSEEAGDTTLETPPADSDGDLVPDYMDPDADNDGLSDENEYSAGTDPTQADSDGDGISDLVEVVAESNPLDPDDTPQSHGDFVFIVPFEEPTTPAEDTLEFRTSVQFADLYFLFDETGSMSAEFAAMNHPTNGVPAIISDLRCADSGVSCQIDSQCASGEICFHGTDTCVEDPLTANGGAGCVPDLWTGVGHFNNCNTYRNSLHLQPNPTQTANAIGGTGPGSVEAVVQAAACVGNPALCSNNPACSAHPLVTTPVGCAGFRPDAVRILIHIFDADNQGGTCSNLVPDIATAGAALQQQGIKYIGLHGTSDDGSGTMCTTPAECAEFIGEAAGTVDAAGEPFAYGALDAAVKQATVDAVLELVRGVALDVTIGASDQPGDAGDALQFIDYLEVNVSGSGGCTNVTPTDDSDGDGRDDRFPELFGGTPVCWNVVPVATQSSVPPTGEPQLFVAKLTVFGDGSPLDERDVFFIVPPVIETPPPPR